MLQRQWPIRKSRKSQINGKTNRKQWHKFVLSSGSWLVTQLSKRIYRNSLRILLTDCWWQNDNQESSFLFVCIHILLFCLLSMMFAIPFSLSLSNGYNRKINCRWFEFGINSVASHIISCKYQYIHHLKRLSWASWHTPVSSLWI